MSVAFFDTQQRFAHRIKDGRVCHTLLPTQQVREGLQFAYSKKGVKGEEASAHGRSSYLPVAEVLFKGLWQCGFVPQLQMLPSSP